MQKPWQKLYPDEGTDIVFQWDEFEMKQKIVRINNKSMHFCITDFVRLTSFNHFTASLIRKLHRSLDAVVLVDVDIGLRISSLVFLREIFFIFLSLSLLVFYE